MKKLRPGEMVQIKTVEELLGVVNEESAMDIEIYKIRSFQGHPFKVVDDDKMLELVESIKANGVLSPVLIRPCGNDLYEMISGHRRLHAAKLAGLTAIPSIIREMTDDEATIAMVDANIQREELLPSEKAWAYKMKMDAMKSQGKRNDLTLGQNGPKLTVDVISDETGDSSRQVKRYIRLTELIPDLLDLVDAKRLNFTVAVDVSYIDKEIQGWLTEYIHDNGPVKANQIAALREAIATGPITQMKMIMILNDTQPGKKPSSKFTMQEKETVKDVIKRIHGAASNPTLDSVGTSDVLVLNRNGEMSCYYIDKDRLVPIRNFIRSTNGGNIINIDTRDYEIEGKVGKWQSTDELILDGNFFYLMENQKYRGDAAAVILDTYGKISADDVMHGFDEETKQKIRDSLKKPALEKKPDPELVQTERMLLWQKYLQNGTWERRSESGTEANYDMVDGRVNNMPEEKPDQQPRSKKKSKKRVSVIRRLHQKQIDIAKRSGKPVPMYLQEAERNRK